ncbi:MORN repeat-containing protein 3-like [Oscarella lobularis]|uniref:MORN repeat-containing protein 3-like n=1 Tax=Oscarella lobularis TaxID=121494 RepID=UPI003313704F
MLKGKQSNQLWKQWDAKAQKEGIHKTVYFAHGDEYSGDWKNNKKSGKGTQRRKDGTVYDGDWKDDKRHGFGTLAMRLKSEKFDQYRKLYAGGWKNDKRHGYGTNYYREDQYYEGEWYEDKRSGWGRMYYSDGSIYEGEWFNDKRNGQGMHRLSNDNRYEGSWKDDKKHGSGKFFYLDKGQVYQGTWIDDVPKCGSLEGFDEERASNPPEFPIPVCTLADRESVLQEGVSQVLSEDT